MDVSLSVSRTRRASGTHINHEDLFDAALSVSFGLSTPYANAGDIARQRVILFLLRAVKSIADRETSPARARASDELYTSGLSL